MSCCVCVTVLFRERRKQPSPEGDWVPGSSCEFVYLKLTFIFTTFLLLLDIDLGFVAGLCGYGNFVSFARVINGMNFGVYGKFISLT